MNNEAPIFYQQARVPRPLNQILKKRKKKTAPVLFQAKVILFFLGFLEAFWPHIILYSFALPFIQSTNSNESKSRPGNSFSFNWPYLFVLIIRIVNAKYLLKVYHSTRVKITVALFLSGLSCILVAFHKKDVLYAASGWLLFLIANILGDSCVLGLLKGFPPKVFVGYSSGIGAGSLIGLVYKCFIEFFGHDSYSVVFWMIPLYIVYYILFSHLLNAKLEFNKIKSLPERRIQTVEERESSVNWQFSLSLIPLILSKIGQYSFYYGLVCLFTEAIRKHLAPSVFDRFKNDSKMDYANSFAAVFFEFGFFLACFSLKLFKLTQLNLLCWIQGAFFASGIYFATFVGISAYSMTIVMFCAGFVYGLSYANTIYAILHDSWISRGEKELCLNVNAIMANAGILFSKLAFGSLKDFMSLFNL